MRLSAFLPSSGDEPPYPAADVSETPLTADEKRQAAALMRVNHAGEVSAQALYHGQALVARDRRIRRQLLETAGEERAHLQWCARRLRELGARPSRLSPAWYGGSFVIGAVAGLAGDAVSLGFVEETERQVVAHLDAHLQRLPAHDARSSAVLNAMRRDEQRHGARAAQAGASALPAPVRAVMGRVADVMKFVAYRV
ncbi:MAG TPA: 2-polyprenyl-3-methyl-6-methoxy-1,4-benzoquinone monooxygenase [Nevskiaceae bacterium]